uniref:Uncharacterized protein n=1 Tax=Canis lupus familiaris TaxID=9615 RepID=A0A8P0TPA1_CANLF
EAGCGGPGWGSAGIPGSVPGARMLPAAGAARREPVGEGEERRARHPPAPALRLLNRKPQGGSGEIKTPENDLQRGRLSRGPRAAAPAPGLGDPGGRSEHSATHAPGAPADAGAAARNALLHNGFHPPPVQPPRLPLLPEPQPQPLPPQHDSPAKKCRLRRRTSKHRLPFPWFSMDIGGTLIKGTCTSSASPAVPCTGLFRCAARTSPAFAPPSAPPEAGLSSLKRTSE